MNDDLLSKACEQAMEIIKSEYYTEEDNFEDINVSEEFEKRMQHLIRIHQKIYYQMINTVGKRIAIILVSISTLFVAINAEAIYRFIVHFSIIDRTIDSSVTFDPQMERETPDYIKEERIPNYIVEGFEEVNRLKDLIFLKITYRNSLDQEYIFTQNLYSATQIINTEDVETSLVEVNGRNVLYCINKGVLIATWSDGSYGYSIKGEITEDDLINIVQSHLIKSRN